MSLRKTIEAWVFHPFQVVILNVFRVLFSIPLFAADKRPWVVGVDETGSNIKNYGDILSPAYTVSLSSNKFYDFKYDYYLDIKNSYFSYLVRLIYGPLLLAYLTNKSSYFLYIWSRGFLVNRDYEFRYLKYNKKKVVCVFVGSDIRSPVLMKRFLKDSRSDGFIDYLGVQNPHYLTVGYDKEKKALAKSADLYADVVFSSNVDQISYLESRVYQAPYTYDVNNFNKNEEKLKDIKKVEILHAPSNPFVKGTPLIRAAIKKLEIEGYEFNYTELQDVSNEDVIEKLKSTHIVLNQFYAYAPGLFGVEAMANNCAVLMSADPKIEISLLKHLDSRWRDFDDYWMITKYWEIYDNLKRLLNDTQLIRYYADKGYEFARCNYTNDAAGKYLKRIFKDNGIIY